MWCLMPACPIQSGVASECELNVAVTHVLCGSIPYNAILPHVREAPERFTRQPSGSLDRLRWTL